MPNNETGSWASGEPIPGTEADIRAAEMEMFYTNCESVSRSLADFKASVPKDRPALFKDLQSINRALQHIEPVEDAAIMADVSEGLAAIARVFAAVPILFPAKAHGEADIRSAALTEPVGEVVVYNEGGSGEHKGIIPIGKLGYSLAESLPVGTLIYTAPPKVQEAAPTDAQLIEAVDAVYPIPDSPHASVETRANDNRVAFLRGYRAALAAPVAQSEPPLDDSLFFPPKAMLKREDWDTATRKPKVTSGESSERAPAKHMVDGMHAFSPESVIKPLINNRLIVSTAKGSIGDDPEFRLAMAKYNVGELTEAEFIAYITNFFASAPATGEQA